MKRKHIGYILWCCQIFNLYFVHVLHTETYIWLPYNNRVCIQNLVEFVNHFIAWTFFHELKWWFHFVVKVHFLKNFRKCITAINNSSLWKSQCFNLHINIPIKYFPLKSVRSLHGESFICCQQLHCNNIISILK